MKLNDKQREVLQALIDGKKVMFRYSHHDVYRKFEEVDQIGHLRDLGAGDHDLEVKILPPPPVRVALFRSQTGSINVFMHAEEGSSWCRRVSDWVEIEVSDDLS